MKYIKVSASTGEFIERLTQIFYSHNDAKSNYEDALMEMNGNNNNLSSEKTSTTEPHLSKKELNP